MAPLLLAVVIVLGIVIMAAFTMFWRVFVCLAPPSRLITGRGDAGAQRILDSLPLSVRALVKMNPPASEMRPSPDFLDAVGRGGELAEIEHMLKQGCVHDLSILRQCRTEMVGGFEIRVVPKGMHIYKAVPGFITADRVATYLSDPIDAPSWFGNKYFCYMVAGNQWWCLISFRLESELRLLDVYVPANLARIIEIAKERGDRFPADWPAEKFIEVMRVTTGYQMPLGDVLTTMHEYNPTWNVFDLYPSPVLPEYTHLYCDPPETEGLIPSLGIMKETYNNDKLLLEHVLGDFPDVDGVIRGGVRSIVESAGSTTEEIVIKGSAQRSKMAFDPDDPLCWLRWKIEGLTVPADGFNMYAPMGFPDDRLAPNRNFDLVRFYLDNPPHLTDLPAGRKYILSFNVHAFRSLNGDSSQEQTVADVLALLRRYASSLEAVVLQEVMWVEGVVQKEQLLWQLRQLGFPFVHIARNGESTRRGGDMTKELFLLVATRKTPRGAIVDTTVRQAEADAATSHLAKVSGRAPRRAWGPSVREQIVFHLDELKVAAVHLEVGYRLKVDSGKSRPIRETNSAIRQHQLAELLKLKPDILIGDFGFEAGDAEASYLAERGYDHIGDSSLKSTPYNRVDHAFVLRAKRDRFGDNILMQCNYSDHLPMFQALAPQAEISRALPPPSLPSRACAPPFFTDPQYNEAERLAIEKAVSVTTPVNRAPRTVDYKVGQTLPYRTVREKTFRSSLHAGQRKLHLSEVDFLTRALAGKGGVNGALTAVYAGAAPGQHTPYLSAQFPNVEWHLYDPAKFEIKATDKVRLYNEYFTDDVARSWAGHCDLFVCDIRLSPDDDAGQDRHAAFEEQVAKDMAMQARWVLLIAPALSMLKFRLPYTLKELKYLAGDVRIQAFATPDSTEGRLITDGKSETVYSVAAHEGYFNYYNLVRREWEFFEHDVRARGLDHCSDCALEIAIHGDYLRLRLGREPTSAEVGQEVYALTRQLEFRGLKGLLHGAHGVDPEIPMCQKREKAYQWFWEWHQKRHAARRGDPKKRKSGSTGASGGDGTGFGVSSEG